MERMPDQAAAQGLRQHSIGPTFPAIIVGHPTEDLKGIEYYVQFMGHRTLSLPKEAAHKVGVNIAKIYRNKGYGQALNIFKDAIIYQGKVE